MWYVLDINQNCLEFFDDENEAYNWASGNVYEEYMIVYKEQ